MLSFSMIESQPDPVTRPNSALAGPPHLAGLRFVNAGLEKNPHPREHYDRQFSVTPERQTPESQRTPRIIWPEIDPVEAAKSWAVNEAKRLETFYAGRVILRNQEPERDGINGEDVEYWDSQTSHWRDEHEKLAEEYDRRKRLEAEGKADEGYAQALLLSPIQSPSPPPSDGVIQATAAGIKQHRPAAMRPSQQAVTYRRSPRHQKQPTQPLQLTPEESPKGSSKASKRLELKQVVEEKKLSRMTKSRISKTTTKTARTRKKMGPMDPSAPRLLPWTLRSRTSATYRESSTRAASTKARRPGGGEAPSLKQIRP